MDHECSLQVTGIVITILMIIILIQRGDSSLLVDATVIPRGFFLQRKVGGRVDNMSNQKTKEILKNTLNTSAK